MSPYILCLLFCVAIISRDLDLLVLSCYLSGSRAKSGG